MKARFIAISQRLDENISYAEVRQGLDKQWGALFGVGRLLEGFLPLPLSYEVDFEVYRQGLGLALAGVILSGGNDLGAFASPASIELSRLRDAYEARIIEACLHHKIPLLGICRGAQMLAWYFGSEIEACGGHVGTHRLCFAKNLAQLLGEAGSLDSGGVDCLGEGARMDPAALDFGSSQPSPMHGDFAPASQGALRSTKESSPVLGALSNHTFNPQTISCTAADLDPMDFKTPPFGNGLSPADTSHRLPNSRVHNPKESSPLASSPLFDDPVATNHSHSSFSDTAASTAGYEDSKPGLFISDCALDSSNLAVPSSINDAAPLNPACNPLLPTPSRAYEAASLDPALAIKSRVNCEGFSPKSDGFIDDYRASSNPESSSVFLDTGRLYNGGRALESSLDERMDPCLDSYLASPRLDGLDSYGRSKPYIVNSFHNYCLARLAAPLVPLTWAEDGRIEAFCHRDAPLFGILWHIERPEGLEFNPITRAWLRGFTPFRIMGV